MRRAASATLCCALALCAPTVAAAEPAPSTSPTLARVERIATDTVSASAMLPQPGRLSPTDLRGDAPASDAAADGESEWVVAPIPVANPTLGAGLAVAAIYSFRPIADDTGSQPSTLALGGFYTDGGSWALGSGIKSSFDADRWRVKAIGAAFDLRYDLFSSNGDGSTRFPVHQSGSGILLEAQRELLTDFFVGAFVAYGETLFVPRSGGPAPPGITPTDFDATLATVGLTLESDRRDNQYYPTLGHRIEYRFAQQSESLGSDFDYRKQTAAFNDYSSLLGGVVATRLSLCVVEGDVPFFDECLYGSKGDLRGYETGRYRDDAMFALQVEYRREFGPRWGATAFVGTGQVMPDLGEIGEHESLPSVGVGLRWNAAPANHINLRVDYAQGDDGGTLYISIGEAF